mgnify:CR=1 FL=1
MADQYIEQPNQNDLYLLAALIREMMATTPLISPRELEIMKSSLSTLENLPNLLASYATKTYVDTKVGVTEDTMGTLVTQMSYIQSKLAKVVVPEDTRYYLSQDEIDFVREGMANISQKIVELENLKNELVILSQQLL